MTPVESRQHWPVAMLYAGLFLSAGLLEIMAKFHSLGGNLWQVFALLMVYGLFLGLGVFYFPARFSALQRKSFQDVIGRCLGAPAAWLIANILTPAWAIAWFAYNCVIAMFYLDASLFHADMGHRQFGLLRRLLVPAIWVAVIAPAAAGSITQLARASVFTTKLSLVLIIGLALACIGWIPQALPSDPEWTGLLRLEPRLLLWAAPALLLAGPLAKQLNIDRRGLLMIVALGIVAPLLIAVLAAAITIAGASGINDNFGKFANYWSVAYARTEKLGWGKLLLMTFTLSRPAALRRTWFWGWLPAGGLSRWPS